MTQKFDIGKSYLFERRGLYSNPKTIRLIKEINAISE